MSEVEGVLAIHRFVEELPVGEHVRTRALLSRRPVLMPAGEAILVGDALPEVPAMASVRAEMDRLREELRLTHRHAGNLEASIEGLQASRQRQHKQIERLQTQAAQGARYRGRRRRELGRGRRSLAPTCAPALIGPD